MGKTGNTQESQVPVGTSQSEIDQIEYIADLVLELRELARKYNLSTLAGILDLAHAEARQRAKDHA
ncbi:hypothetical protein [Hyphomicrobium sp.]|uniref:hypothetical protein n=1 Tax=Hyphomicrobium sp. TaxID=82 RepID=UPI0025C60BA2|nr:hypothetical protein [Hyphomicrobium sp.]MCC7250920.1 hypothetical protein [Hyphomicrobium sp.]